MLVSGISGREVPCGEKPKNGEKTLNADVSDDGKRMKEYFLIEAKRTGQWRRIKNVEKCGYD